MRNLFTLVGAAIVIFGGLGWYLGWYQVQTATTSTGHRTINIDVNQQKIAEDVKKGEQKVQAAVAPNNPTGTTVTPAVPPPPPAAPAPAPIVQVNNDGTLTLPALSIPTTK
jgi:apolipoprotein N-acyltransferase